MLNIDNAVEQVIKTYLGLPKRITGVSVSKKRYDEFSQNFSELLGALEQYDGGKLVGINLGEIEWYHRLRNQLYHEGNGLTVERSKVETYAALAKVLFRNLFSEEVGVGEPPESELLGEFLMAWAELEQLVYAAAEVDQVSLIIRFHFSNYLRQLVDSGILDEPALKAILELRATRKDVVHGGPGKRRKVAVGMVVRLREVIDTLDSAVARAKARNRPAAC